MPTTFCRTIPSWKNYARPASKLPGAQSRNTARRCIFLRPCSDGEKSRCRRVRRVRSHRPQDVALCQPPRSSGSCADIYILSEMPQARRPLMSLRVSGKNIDIGEVLRARVDARVAEAATKYFDGGFSGHVTISREGFGFRTECAIHLDSGITLEAD